MATAACATLVAASPSSFPILYTNHRSSPAPPSAAVTEAHRGTVEAEEAGGGEGEGESGERNREEALIALAEIGRTLENIPSDLAAAIDAGRIPGSIVRRFGELEKSPVFRWLLQFGWFKERLFADDLFLAKVAMECGVGIFTKTAAEYERRRELFFKELDFVVADVSGHLVVHRLSKSCRSRDTFNSRSFFSLARLIRIKYLDHAISSIRKRHRDIIILQIMAIIADFMLVWLPAPTVSLRPPLAVSAGAVAKFFHNCPDNAFQVALAGTSYSFAQRIGAIVRNGSKLFVVGTSASLIGTGITNALINVRKAIDKDFSGVTEDVPIVPTSVAYGVYMAVSSNLRYQVVAGVIEQRILEPLLHDKKLILSALCFAVRTGNTFLGSLMWVDYARWVGIQKIREE